MDLVGSELGEKIIAESDQVHQVQRQFHQLPNEEKEQYLREKFEREGLNPFFGYRLLNQVKREDGTVERDENYNVS